MVQTASELGRRGGGHATGEERAAGGLAHCSGPTPVPQLRRSGKESGGRVRGCQRTGKGG